MPTPSRPRVVIVTPALAEANNGNWQTASRWARLLRPHAEVSVVARWTADGPGHPHDVMLALHAGRSADAVQAWVRMHGATGTARGLAVVLTGTDLYRDLAGPDAQADARVRASLQAASALVVLQDHAPAALPHALRSKARVIFQSTPSRRTLAKTARHLRAVMVGHLRDEKDPLTLMRAAALLRPDEGILIDHIGAPLDADLAHQALATQARHAHYRWLGGVPHEAARRRIQRAHLLVHASRLEGGAHVVMEALCSGTPVLASRMAGNLGMLGREYPGYFEVGDAAGLADALRHLRHRPSALQALQTHGQRRAEVFAPEREQQELWRLVRDLLPGARAADPSVQPP